MTGSVAGEHVVGTVQRCQTLFPCIKCEFVLCKSVGCSVFLFQVITCQLSLHELPTAPATTNTKTKSLYTACLGVQGSDLSTSDTSGQSELCERRGQSRSIEYKVLHFVHRDVAFMLYRALVIWKTVVSITLTQVKFAG